MHNIHSPLMTEHCCEPKWHNFLILVFGTNWRPLNSFTIIDLSRRDDQLIKRVMTFIKDLIYKPYKEQKILVDQVWRRRSKEEAFEALGEDLKIKKDMRDSWFGSKLKDGLKNGMVDFLFQLEGQTFFDKITQIEFVDCLIEVLHSQTDQDIQTNIVSKLSSPQMWTSFVESKDQSTKLPTSYNCNLMSCLYFYQKLLCRKLDYSVHESEHDNSVHKLRRVLIHLRNKIGSTNLNMSQAQPDQRGYIKLDKRVKICYQIKNWA